MNRSVLSVSLVALLVPLAGCLGGDGDAWRDFKPGEGFNETGRTVHLRMWVEDLVKADIYPGFKANLWAFCAEPANPDDAYSAAAIEYREPTGVVERLQSDNTFRIDEDATGKCSVPGPQLRVQQGDRVIVDFQNDHFHPHTIHWHGQFVPWESDGVPGSTQDSVVPGTSFRYDFIAKRAGTLWYHCHVDTQFHIMQGLFGVMVVEPQDKTFEPDTDKEYTLVMHNGIRSLVEYVPPAPGQAFDPHAEHRHSVCGGQSGLPGCQNPAVEDDDVDVFMLNGVSAPYTFERDDTLIKIKPGEKIRLRILNAGPFAVNALHLHGHDFQITHWDGNPLHPDARKWVDTLLLAPGQRADVLIEGREDAQGVWVFHDHLTNHVTNDGEYPGGILTKLVYEGFEDDITPFDVHESVGGDVVRSPVTLPDDYRDRQVLALPTQQSGSLGEWTFPVTQACAAAGFSVDGALIPANAATGLLNDVTADLVAPDGSVVFSAALGGPTGDSGFFWAVNETSATLAAKDLRNGDYKVRLSGQAVDSHFDASVLVDYYPDLAAADEAAGVYGKELCGVFPQSVLDENGY